MTSATPFWVFNDPKSRPTSWARTGVSSPMAMPLQALPMAVPFIPNMRPVAPPYRRPTRLARRPVMIRGAEDGKGDLESLESVINFNLSEILPPDFSIDNDENSKHDNDRSPMISTCTDSGMHLTPIEITFPRVGTCERMIQDSPNEVETEISCTDRTETEPEHVDERSDSPRLVIDTSNTGGDLVRPPYSYSELIDFAMRDKGLMTVRDIYRWIGGNFEYYRNLDPNKWQPSVRHTLTISPAFKKVKKVRGGNQWGPASEGELSNARQQKNHWKKQKIAEYEQRSSSRPRADEEDPAAAGEPCPLLEISATMDEEDDESKGEEMLEMDPENEEEESEESDRKSRKPHKETPAKKPRRPAWEMEERMVDLPKTHTRRGRVTTKLNYKEFSTRGKRQPTDPHPLLLLPPGSSARGGHDGGDDPALTRCAAHNNSPDYTSEEDTDDNVDGFDDDVMMDKSDGGRGGRQQQQPLLHEPGCTNHHHHHHHHHGHLAIAPDDMPLHLNSESERLSTQQDDDDDDDDVAFPGGDGGGGASQASLGGGPPGTPGQLVVSDLQDFEPSESAESLLASTSAMTSFPSTTEAAMILSSLEASPGISRGGGAAQQQQQARLALNVDGGMTTMSKDGGQGMEESLGGVFDPSSSGMNAGTSQQTSREKVDEGSDHQRRTAAGVIPNTSDGRGTTGAGDEAGGKETSSTSGDLRVPCGTSPLTPPWLTKHGSLIAAMDAKEPSPQRHLLHDDVPLSDAWRHQPQCKKCRVHNASPGGARSFPRTGMHHPVAFPVYMPRSTTMRAPGFMYTRSPRPMSPYSLTGFHPVMMVPSPIRPEQIQQAFLPFETVVRRPSAGLGSPSGGQLNNKTSQPDQDLADLDPEHVVPVAEDGLQTDPGAGGAPTLASGSPELVSGQILEELPLADSMDDIEPAHSSSHQMVACKNANTELSPNSSANEALREK